MKYVALLRGINVGGNNKVAMPKLKECFESLGYTNVSTYINSGNVIFESKSKDLAKMSSHIEKGIEKTFGFKIRVVVRDEKNIQKICEGVSSDWKNDNEQKTDVLFLWDKYDSKKSIDLVSTKPKIDTLVYFPGAIVWHINKSDYSKSGMNNFIGTTLYKNMTARNINTVRKLGGLMKKD